MPGVNNKGWFGHHRTLQEQLLGLAPALAETKGRRVLDAGCAEALIAIEFHRAGARSVDAFDNNPELLSEAKRQSRQLTNNAVRVSGGDLNAGLPDWLEPPYDIVLALAVLHKAASVPAATKALADAAGSLLVIRLPLGSTGVLNAKHGTSVCDLHKDLPQHGLALERTEDGPRRELVQYWRRR